MFKIEQILRVHTHDENIIGKQIQSERFARKNKFRCFTKSTFDLIGIQFGNIRSKSSIESTHSIRESISYWTSFGSPTSTCSTS